MNTIQLPLEARDKVVPLPVASRRDNDAAWSSLLRPGYVPPALLKKRERAAKQAAKIAAALAAHGVTLDKLVSACLASKGTFTPADSTDLPMFEADYQI